MAGKTISAYIDERIARRIEYLAEVEHRKVSQLAAAALSLYTALPREAHAALRQVEALGGKEDLERVTRQMARVLLDAQYEVARRGVVEDMDLSGLGALGSEEAILEAATRLTAHQETGARRPGERMRQRAERALGSKEKPRGTGRGPIPGG